MHTRVAQELGTWTDEKTGYRYLITELQTREGKVYWETSKIGSSEEPYAQIARKNGNCIRMRCNCPNSFWRTESFCKHLKALKRQLRRNKRRVWRG